MTADRPLAGAVMYSKLVKLLYMNGFRSLENRGVWGWQLRRGPRAQDRVCWNKRSQ